LIFYSCNNASAMNKKLDEDFYSKTCIRISKSKGHIRYDFIHFDETDYTIQGNVGTFKGDLMVYLLLVGHSFKWRSKDGSTIRPYHEIDENNIEFWFDNFDKNLVIQEWRSHPPKLGFSTVPLNFSLHVDHFYEHFYLLISFIKNDEEKVKFTVLVLNQMLSAWNEASLAKNRRFGIVHSWIEEKVTPNYVKFYIDFGSAHEKLLKQILESLNDIEGIEKVTITSYPDED